jgi:hypothetical protein
MTIGDTTYGGLGVPLTGEFQIKQTTLGTDIMTISGATSQSGDFIVCRDVDGVEKFVVTVDGAMGADLSMASGKYVGFANIPATFPTTGVTKGDIFTMESSTYMQLAVAQTANVIRYINTTSA